MCVRHPHQILPPPSTSSPLLRVLHKTAQPKKDLHVLKTKSMLHHNTMAMWLLLQAKLDSDTKELNLTNNEPPSQLLQTAYLKHREQAIFCPCQTYHWISQTPYPFELAIRPGQRLSQRVHGYKMACSRLCCLPLIWIWFIQYFCSY